jgi:RNA polymerase sigma-70 factor (ECF subfamily)
LPQLERAQAPSAADPLSSCASEEELALVGRIRLGDQTAFNDLYERYFQRIYNFAYVRVRNHADAEEITQETFTGVFRCIEAFRGQASLVSWIYGIAKNTVNNHLRRLKNQEARFEQASAELARQPMAAAALDPEEQLTLRRYIDAIQQRLGDIARWQVEVFMLRHVENLPIPEIARRTERSSDAIRSSLYRVKRLLVEASDPGLAPNRA